MAATAFAEVQSPDAEGTREVPSPDPRNCAVDPFTFTRQDDEDTLEPRFAGWIERALSVALRHWSEYIP